MASSSRNEQDRAELDLGMQLYARSVTGPRSLGQVRVSFQLKGMRTAALTANGERVAVGDLRVADLRYWHWVGSLRS